MSIWWPLIFAYWIWFVLDCLSFARRSRFRITSASGRSQGHITYQSIGFAPPSPLAWQAKSDDPSFAFSAEGLCNIPVGSCGRPSPLPAEARAWKWEEVLEVKEKNGRTLINGQDFCAANPLSSAEVIQTLCRQTNAIEPEERSAFLAKKISRWFIPFHLQRQVVVLRARTALVAWLGLANFSIAVLISVYLLGNFATRLEPEVAERCAAVLPFLGLAFLALQVATLRAAWTAHRHLRPSEKKERAQLISNAALLPSQALRLRAQISALYFLPAHPLAWLRVLRDRAERETYAQQILGDLNWPLSKPQVNEAALVGSITSWMRGRITREVDLLLKSNGLQAEKLLAPPIRDSDSSRNYCPRCRSQFLEGTAFCPEGVKLQTLK